MCARCFRPLPIRSKFYLVWAKSDQLRCLRDSFSVWLSHWSDSKHIICVHANITSNNLTGRSHFARLRGFVKLLVTNAKHKWSAETLGQLCAGILRDASHVVAVCHRTSTSGTLLCSLAIIWTHWRLCYSITSRIMDYGSAVCWALHALFLYPWWS